MVTTVMREVTLIVKVAAPEATLVQKLEKKSLEAQEKGEGGYLMFDLESCDDEKQEKGKFKILNPVDLLPPKD